jgi:hypothetical protein
MVMIGRGLPTSLIVSLNALEQDTGFVALIKSIWHWGWMVSVTFSHDISITEARTSYGMESLGHEKSGHRSSNPRSSISSTA